MTRILHVCSDVSPRNGGVARVVIQLAHEESRLGARVSLWTLGRPDADMGEIDSDHMVRYHPNPLALGDAIRKAARELDIVHIHGIWDPTCTVAAYACRKADLRYVISPHGMLATPCIERKSWKKRLYFAFVEKHSLSGAAAIHYLNKREQELSNTFRLYVKRSFVVPNGVDVDSVRRAVCQAHASADRSARTVVFLGRLHEIKGLELQVEAAALLRRLGFDFRWLLVGRDCGVWPVLSARIRRLGLEDVFVWGGPVNGEQRFGILRDADVVCLTSHYECHSVSANEAMAVGTPLVLTESVNYSEVAEYGAGRVVPRSASAVAEAIRELFCNGDLARSMSAAGVAYARRYLDWPTIAETMLSEYSTVLRQ